MFSLIIDYWIDSGIYSAFIMIVINLIIDKSRLCYKNYNKILTKRKVCSIILEQTPDQDLHKKKSAYFKHTDFSAAKIEKSAQITRANTVVGRRIIRAWSPGYISTFCDIIYNY